MTGGGGGREEGLDIGVALLPTVFVDTAHCCLDRKQAAQHRPRDPYDCRGAEADSLDCWRQSAGEATASALPPASQLPLIFAFFFFFFFFFAPPSLPFPSQPIVLQTPGAMLSSQEERELAQAQFEEDLAAMRTRPAVTLKPLKDANNRLKINRMGKV